MTQQEINNMHFVTFKGVSKFVALAKKEPFVTNPPDFIREPGDVWFEFGSTPEKAINNLKESLRKNEI